MIDLRCPLLFRRSQAPAGIFDTRMLFESRDYLIKLARIGSRPHQCCDKLRLALFSFDDFDVLRRIVGQLQPFPQQFAVLVKILRACRQPNLIDRFRCSLIDGSAIDRVDQRAQ